MGLFNKKKTNEPRPAVADMTSIFMCDDSEGNHGKEAMLDYQLSYLLRLANTSDNGNELAKRTLMKLAGKTPILDSYGNVDNLYIESVKVWKQWQYIDLIAEVEADWDWINSPFNTEKHVIVIENKAYTKIHDDQLSRYSEIVEDYYKDQEVQIHYWVITFYDRDTEEFESIATQCREAKGDWKCLSFEEFLDLTEEERNKGTYNEIIDEFWVKKWY